MRSSFGRVEFGGILIRVAGSVNPDRTPRRFDRRGSTYDAGKNPSHYQQQVVATVAIP